MEKSFVVAAITREDLDYLGFDTTNIDDSIMLELADKMHDDYLEQLYWQHMEQIASENLNLPRKRKNDVNICNKTFYSVEDVDGIKMVHILGYPYNADGYHNSMEFTGVYFSVKDVKKCYENGKITSEIDKCKQYFTQHKSTEEQYKYWIGDNYNGEMELTNVSEITPCGVYSCEDL